MGHILNLKSKYNIEIEVDKQLIFDGQTPKELGFPPFQ